jgi:hypothetical protein
MRRADRRVIRHYPVVTQAEARSYLRNLAALHISFGLIPLGGLLAIAGADVIGGPLLIVGCIGWVFAISAGWLRTARHHRGKPMFGCDSIMAEANWWIGWGPILEAAEATGADPRRVKHLAVAAVVATVAMWVLIFPVAALFG